MAPRTKKAAAKAAAEDDVSMTDAPATQENDGAVDEVLAQMAAVQNVRVVC
jgi:RNase P/RNase MRP subunit p30